MGLDLLDLAFRQVTRRQMLHIELDQFLLKFWFVLLPVVLLICFGIAASLPRARSTAGTASDSSNKL